MDKLRGKQENNFEAYRVYVEKLFSQYDKVARLF